MFPVLPQFINSGTEISSTSSEKTVLNLSHKNANSNTRTNSMLDLTLREDFQSITKVTAMTDIPHGTCSEDIDVTAEDRSTRKIHNVSNLNL